MKKLIILNVVLAFSLMMGLAYATYQEQILNGGLENWTAGAPDNWDLTNWNGDDGSVNSSPDYTIAIETANLNTDTAGTKALVQTRNSSDYTFRYFLTSNVIPTLTTGATASFVGYVKGNDTRCYMATSADAGVTWLMAPSFGNPIGGVTNPPIDSWVKLTASIGGLDDAATLHRLTFHSFSAGQHWVDDVSLMGNDTTVPPLGVGSITPDVKLLLSGTNTLTAVPTGGTGTYNSVKFDIGNDGSDEATDTTAPYEYIWDTNASEAGYGAVQVKVTVTDSSLATGSTIFTYTIDNRNGGRVELATTNPDFEDWDTGTPSLPIGWVDNQLAASAGNAVVAQDVGYDATGKSLEITFTNFDNANRYTLRYVGKQNDSGVYTNHQVTYWGKGAPSALQYWKSTDGTTWENANIVAASAGTPDWTLGIGDVAPVVASNTGEWTTLTTINLQMSEWYDHLSWKATPPAMPTPTPKPLSVRGKWDIYE